MSPSRGLSGPYKEGDILSLTTDHFCVFVTLILSYRDHMYVRISSIVALASAVLYAQSGAATPISPASGPAVQAAFSIPALGPKPQEIPARSPRMPFPALVLKRWGP
ncbi:hypothetical protein C8R44DRAFT_366298 [Mycena epipterygia]|nr:hypothetical protein C8R44DRAFT_366298 [Mycena epipterygia]